jgi:hypothetical protein
VTQEAGTFWYRPIRTFIALAVFLVAGVVLMVIFFSPRATGSRMAGAMLFLVGAWGVFYVVRRLGSPARIEVRDQKLEAAFWKGDRRTWPLAELRIRPSNLGSFWEGSTVVTFVPDGRVAFRVFRDLVGYDSLREILKQSAA